MKKFIPGRTYQTRSICDYEWIIKITVLSRTKCFIRTAPGTHLADGKKLKVSIDYDGNESVMPHGRHSMAPCISAD